MLKNRTYRFQFYFFCILTDEFDNSLQQFNSIQDPDYVYEINDGDINHNELILKQNPEK